MSDEQSHKLEIITFKEGGSLEVPEEFTPKRKDLDSFSIACTIEHVSIVRALYDLASSVSLMPYSILRSFT